MSDLATGNGAPGWEWRGRHVRLIDHAALARFERRVFSLHFQALQDMRGMISDEDYERQLALVREQRASGAYSLKGHLGRAYVQGQDGAELLLTLILDYDGQARLDAGALLFADPKAAGEMIAQVLADSGLAPAPKAAARPT